VSGPVVAPRPAQFATRIPWRRVEFKRHNTLGQAKNALLVYDFFTRDTVTRPPGAPLYGPLEVDGVFRVSMTLYRLDPCQHEYVPWVEIVAGTRRSAYPELMPAGGKR
jgi:hypothetical protein